MEKKKNVICSNGNNFFLRNRIAIYSWLFLAPTIILFCMFTLWPMGTSFYYAFHDWAGFGAIDAFVGFENFIEVANDSYFWNAFGNSFIFMIGVVPIHVFVGLIIAIVLNDKMLKFAEGYRTLFFLPVITTASIVGTIMIFVLGADGPVNALLQFLKIIKVPINWLGDPKYALFTIIIVSGWKNLGTNMIYWLAALQSIPKELYEAGRIDGCTNFKLFIHITVPTIAPIGAIIALLNIVGSLKAFDLVKTMTNGGPFFATDVVSTYIYRYAFSSEIGLPRMGYASAAGIFFGLTVIIVGVIANAMKSKVENNSGM